MPGSIASNFHEGSRSEYLAQFVFSSFGTAVPVPHQEDSGIDLYCTLTERLGHREFPTAHYSVQVKSSMDPWVMGDAESVRWIVQHPVPLFICVVDKAALTLRVYHTCPRFFLWSVPPLPSRLELTPSTDRRGVCTQWNGSHSFSLSAPIIEYTLPELFDYENRARAKSVLGMWIEFEIRNLAWVRAGIYQFRMPGEYETNVADPTSWVQQGINVAPDLEHAERTIGEELEYLAERFRMSGDLAGAAYCAMLLRHISSVLPDTRHPCFVLGAINERIRGEGKDYLFRGVDVLNDLNDRARFVHHSFASRRFS